MRSPDIPRCQVCANKGLVLVNWNVLLLSYNHTIPGTDKHTVVCLNTLIACIIHRRLLLRAISVLIAARAPEGAVPGLPRTISLSSAPVPHWKIHPCKVYKQCPRIRPYKAGMLGSAMEGRNGGSRVSWSCPEGWAGLEEMSASRPLPAIGMA
jgi:hypothetical protein